MTVDSCFILELYAVVHAARVRPRWSVLLVPQARFETTLSTIAALSDVPFYGRTILWPDMNRKLSIAYPEQTVFVPKGGFDLFFAGWTKESKDETKALQTWKDAAHEFVSTTNTASATLSI